MAGPRSGLPVAVAVHSTAPGPAIGGCRIASYRSWHNGVEDALTLAEAMTTKCRLAGLPFGGGKSVSVLPPGRRLLKARRLALLDDIAGVIAACGGRYLAGPDIGTSEDDMAVLHARANGWALGRPQREGGSGDSAPATARGILAALRGALRHTVGDPDARGLTVGIIGYGKVGSLLAHQLRRCGADVTVADRDPARRDAATAAGLPVSADLTLAELDILIPAATGGLIDCEFAKRCAARLIVGPANNQLREAGALNLLADRGTTWVPDVVASAGGIIGATGHEIMALSSSEVNRRIDALEDRVIHLLRHAEDRQVSTLAAALDPDFQSAVAA